MSFVHQTSLSYFRCSPRPRYDPFSRHASVLPSSPKTRCFSSRRRNDLHNARDSSICHLRWPTPSASDIVTHARACDSRDFRRCQVMVRLNWLTSTAGQCSLGSALATGPATFSCSITVIPKGNESPPNHPCVRTSEGTVRAWAWMCACACLLARVCIRLWALRTCVHACIAAAPLVLETRSSSPSFSS